MFIEMMAHSVDGEALSVELRTLPVELGALLGKEGALSFEWEPLSADGSAGAGE